MLTAREEIVIEVLRQRALPVLKQLANVPDNCCIRASRVGQEVLRHFGIEAQALSVDLIVQTDTDRLVVGLERPATYVPGAFYGHVILWANKAILLDLTLSQARGVDPSLSGAKFEVSDLEGLSQGLSFTWPSGTALGYRRARDKSWRYARDWTEKDRRQPAVRQLVGEIEAQLSLIGD
ncbi:hypothetical protein ACIQCR_16665 [Streptomyces sp. NPDC093249]|uniref:hypothetical protein n=1 Tax=unclassified Streptomyces TaxID=2593676 RepID=UPI00382AC1C1